VGRPWVRGRFPEPLGEEALGVASLWPYVAWEGYRVDLKALAFPWHRSFEAEARLSLVPLPSPVHLVE
jgi:hypothetical protein